MGPKKLCATVITLLGLVSLSFSQEPTGRGVISDLIFFDEAVNPICEFDSYSLTTPLLPTPIIAKNGTYSLGATWSVYAGIRPQLAHNDTAVIWFQSNSRLQFWTRSTLGGNTSLRIWARPLGGTSYTVADWFNPGSSADTWYFVDLPIPAELRNIPFIGFEIGGPGVTHTRFFDDLKVTSVRLHAGIGAPPVAAMDFIAASQIGYAPGMTKEFSSPVNFTSFVIKRVNDNVTVYTGGSPSRVVSSNLVSLVPASMYIGNFTAVSTPGRYKIIANGKESLPFNISENVFDAPLRAAQRMLYYQRAFTAIEQPYAEGPWVHPTDIEKAPNGVVKGWHDAGDLTIYMPTMTQTLYWLLQTWNDFHPMADNTNIPESGNGVPDLLDETKWGLDWVLSMQDINTTHTGGFWGTACVGCNNADQGYGQTTPNTVNQYCKVHPPTVQNTAKAVAVLAYAARVFQTINPSYSATCLTAARNGWTWIQENPSVTNDAGTGCDAYAQGNDQSLLKTNRSWAHASLFYATGEAQYNAAYLADYVRTEWISSFSKSEAFANRMYLMANGGDNNIKTEIKARVFGGADAARGDANTHPFQFATYYYWGCNSNAMHRTGQFSWNAFILDPSRTADRDAVLDNINYIFGRNFLNISYVSGSNRWGATRFRTEGFHHWMKTLHVQPDSLWHFPGALAGGPNISPDGNDRSYPGNTPFPTWGYTGDSRGVSGNRIGNIRSGMTPIDGRFTDNDSWSTNEIVISWNAAFIYNLYAAQSVAHGTSLLLPSGSLIVTPDTLPSQGGNVTLTWTSNNATAASINQGIGSVSTSGSQVVTVGQTKTFTLTLVNSLGSQVYSAQVNVELPGGGGSLQDITSTGNPVALITNPTGTGSRNLEIIRDGITPPLGSSNPSEQYDTFNGGGSRQLDWIGYTYASTQSFGSITFQEGVHAAEGGFFSAIPRVEVRVGAQWIDVQGLTITPAYGAGSVSNFSTYTLTFNAISGDGIRIVGAPGGTAQYLSVAELRVMGTATSSVTPDTKPKNFDLLNNYPNPFNPTTTIEFTVSALSHVTLEVFNILGQKIRTLVDQTMDQGKWPVTWDGRDESNRLVSSGVYLYKLQAGDFVSTRKMILSK